jgi:hypothetical protein
VKQQMFPRSFQTLEGRSLRGPVVASFEAYYRAHLRFQVGARVRATNLRSRYLAWAVANEAPALSFVEIRQAMENVGHWHQHSNGAVYGDVTFAEHVDPLPDNFPAPAVELPPVPAELLNVIQGISGRLDQLMSALATFSNKRVVTRAK